MKRNLEERVGDKVGRVDLDINKCIYDLFLGTTTQKIWTLAATVGGAGTGYLYGNSLVEVVGGGAMGVFIGFVGSLYGKILCDTSTE